MTACSGSTPIQALGTTGTDGSRRAVASTSRSVTARRLAGSLRPGEVAAGRHHLDAREPAPGEGLVARVVAVLGGELDGVPPDPSGTQDRAPSPWSGAGSSRSGHVRSSAANAEATPFQATLRRFSTSRRPSSLRMRSRLTASMPSSLQHRHARRAGWRSGASTRGWRPGAAARSGPRARAGRRPCPGGSSPPRR